MKITKKIESFKNLAVENQAKLKGGGNGYWYTCSNGQMVWIKIR